MLMFRPCFVQLSAIAQAKAAFLPSIVAPAAKIRSLSVIRTPVNAELNEVRAMFSYPYCLTLSRGVRANASER